MLGAVNVPEVKVNVLPNVSGLNDPKLAVVAATISALDVPVSPVKPVSAYPVLTVNVPVVFVMVPLPVKVPLKVIPFGIVGFAPRGKEQPELTVFTSVCPLKLTELNA